MGLMNIFKAKGAEPEYEQMDAAASAAMLTQPAGGTRIGKDAIKKAQELLTKYKDGKTNLEARVVEDEQWWKLNHWDVLRKNSNNTLQPTSAWLFNALINKHADALDNYPAPAVLPREKADETAAKELTSVLPVILEQNDFEQTYSDNWWEKLKHGTAAYGVFWNSKKENGLGDIDIKEIDLLKIFWEPGITDIQKSANLFIVDLIDREQLAGAYPAQAEQIKGAGDIITAKEYIYDDTVDTEDKVLVVDWYYKRVNASGLKVLHYVKFVGDVLLYASENDENYRERGFYDHGMYPVVFDTLFPEKGTPVGFGYVAICKDPQMYIDKLSANILEKSLMATKVRYFALGNTNINEKEFLDWNQPIVHVEGNTLDETRLRQIEVGGVDGNSLSVLQMKVEEMKDTAGNRDVNSGGTGSGVTAAAAIAALQEAGNKTSRDMIKAAYRAYVGICTLCIELIRQFYDETRYFRITGESAGAYEFVAVNNAAMGDQEMKGADGMVYLRHPAFDLKIQAQKSNPFSQMAINETAKELYNLGVFNPDRAQEAMILMEMMQFEGKDKVMEKLAEGQTLLNMLKAANKQLAAAEAVLSGIAGAEMMQSGNGGVSADGGKSAADGGNAAKSGFAKSAKAAQTPMTDYGQRLAERSTPSVE